MSQVIATQTASLKNNANAAAISTPAEIDIVSLVAKNANRQSKNGVVIQATSCNRSKLFSATCAEVKSLLGMEATARLSAEWATKIDESIDTFLLSIISSITPSNIVSHSRSYRHKQSDLAVVEQVRLTGFNVLSLEKQFHGIGELIKQANKRLVTLRNNYADREIIENAEKSVLRMETTKSHIHTQIEKLKETQSGK